MAVTVVIARLCPGLEVFQGDGFDSFLCEINRILNHGVGIGDGADAFGSEIGYRDVGHLLFLR